MDWLDTSRLHGVAKRYAHALPKFLRDAYLGSEFYTRPQIERAVGALRLPKDFIGMAYATYLSEIDYDEVYGTLPIPMSYKEAREEFFRHVHDPGPTSEWNPLTTSTLFGRL